MAIVVAKKTGQPASFDVLELCDLIQRTVAKQFGVHLVPEISVLGEPVRRTDG